MYNFKCKLRKEGNPSQTHKVEHYQTSKNYIINSWKLDGFNRILMRFYIKQNQRLLDYFRIKILFIA